MQLPANTVNYSDVALKQTTAYNYQLNAYNDQTVPPWTGDWSSPPVYASTTNLTLSAYSKTPTTVKLTWASVSGATGYRVESYVTTTVCGWGCSTTASWVAVGTVGSGVTTYTVTGLTANTSYIYRVVPTNASGDMTPTGSVTISTTYINLVVSSSGGTALDLSWGNVAAVNGYRLERKTGTGAEARLPVAWHAGEP